MDAFFNRNRHSALRRTSSPLFKGTLICDENLTISFQGKKVLKMTQCWPVGFTILELAKWHMTSLYYDRIVPALGEGNVAVVMSDTDSFLLTVNSESEDRTMKLLAPYMDFSNLDPGHPLYSKQYARVPGLLKNEVPRAVITEVAALKSKTYGIRTAVRKMGVETEVRMENKAKGVSGASRRRLQLDHYKRCLRRMDKVEVTERSIRSVRHINQLVTSKKVAFSSFDDKRYLLCPKHSAPYGSTLVEYRLYHGMEDYCYFCEHPNELY